MGSIFCMECPGLEMIKSSYSFAERDLVLEIDRLKHKNGFHKKRGKSPDRLTQFLRGVEEERDYWKGEVEVLQKLLRSRSISPTRAKSPQRASRSPARSPTRAKSPSRSLTSTPSKSRSRNASPVGKELEVGGHCLKIGGHLMCKWMEYVTWQTTVYAGAQSCGHVPSTHLKIRHP